MALPAPSHRAPRTIQTDAGPVEVAEAGQGAPVLSLHGGMGGYDQALLLARCMVGEAAGFRILAPSRPGYLGTPALGRTTPAAQARLFAALLDAQGIRRVLVMALSAGGPSALQFALDYPERCAGLVLVSTVTGALDIPPAALRRLPLIRLAARVPPLAGLVSWVARVRPERAAGRSVLDPVVCRATLAHPEAGPLMRAIQESVASRIAERLDATLSDVDRFCAMTPFDLGDLSVPLFAVHGSGDRVVPVAHFDRVAAARPDATLLRLPGAEHVCLVTHLDEIRTALRPFLAAYVGQGA
ncbi:MAG: hypothetical protein B7Y84_10360 [Azorhizobium sp. 32-67-21]|nr:MAG: hypothetical protein B7Y84_10360 [Azorhizobium sp. 32-67-21]